MKVKKLKKIASPQMSLLILHLKRYCKDNPNRLQEPLRAYYRSLAPSTRQRLLYKIREEKIIQGFIESQAREIKLAEKQAQKNDPNYVKPLRGWKKHCQPHV